MVCVGNGNDLRLRLRNERFIGCVKQATAARKTEKNVDPGIAFCEFRVLESNERLDPCVLEGMRRLLVHH